MNSCCECIASSRRLFLMNWSRILLLSAGVAAWLVSPCARAASGNFSTQSRNESKAGLYQIDAQFPHMTSGAAAAGFNHQIEGDIGRFIAHFVSDVQQYALPCDKGACSRLTVHYKIPFATNDFVSVIFEVTPQLLGATYPEFWLVTMNYDARRNRMLRLADLFRPGSAYLGSAASLCRRALQPSAHVLTNLVAGTTPIESHYRRFTLGQYDVTIYFNAYQLGPFSAGPQQVTIPYDKFLPLLAKNGIPSQLQPP